MGEPKTTDPLDTKALRALAAEATPEWRGVAGCNVEGEWAACGPVHRPELLVGDFAAEQYAEADARYIAAVSPDVVLALLDRIEALEAEVAPEMCQDMACGREGLFPVCREHYEEPAKLRAEVERLRRIEEAAREYWRRGPDAWPALGDALDVKPPPVVVDGECMQDCDALGVPCPKREVKP